MIRAGTLVANVVVELGKRNPDRDNTLHHIKLRLAEMQARHEFHLNPTPKNLTDWYDTKEQLDADGAALVAAIHLRRQRKCIAAGTHTDTPAGCPRCGTEPPTGMIR